MKPKNVFVFVFFVALCFWGFFASGQDPSARPTQNECNDGDCLLCCLNRPIGDPYVQQLISIYELQNLGGYAYSNKEKGLGISVSDDLVSRITIYPGFSSGLPLGISLNMSKAGCEALLGTSSLSWDKGYRISVDGNTQITVSYLDKKCLKIEYVCFDPLDGFISPPLCYEKKILLREESGAVSTDPCGLNQSDCLLCYLTRSCDDADVKTFIERNALKELGFSFILANADRGIEIWCNEKVTSIILFPEKFQGPLPLIGGATTSQEAIWTQYPNAVVNSPYIDFIYKDFIKVSVVYGDDWATINKVEYKVMPFVQFSAECLKNGLESMHTLNREAIGKNLLVSDIKKLFKSCPTSLSEAREMPIGTFDKGTAKEGVYALRMYAGLSRDEANRQLESMKAVLAEVKFGTDIMLSRKDGLPLKPEVVRQLNELLGAGAISASEFTRSLEVSAYNYQYSNYKNTSMHLLINPASNGKYDIYLVVLF